MPHTLDVSRLQEIFDELEVEDRLSKWEEGFVASIQAQWEEGKTLTDNQLTKLEEIWVRLG